MATNTPNLVLRKPDGVDLVNVLADLDANYDKIDAMFDAWTTYTPVWTTSGTAPALGNGSIVGRYRKAGKFLDFYIGLTLGSTSTVGTGNWQFSLPVGLTGVAAITQRFLSGVVAKAATGNFPVMSILNGSSNVMQFLVPNGGALSSLGFLTNVLPINAWAAGDFVSVQGRVELA